MSTAIAVLGGVGLFLLGMTVMTGGLKAMAGSALRVVLAKQRPRRSPVPSGARLSRSSFSLRAP